jgi:ATP-dependent DNA helicase DinG
MLADHIKDEIQNAYRQILSRKSLRARSGQRLMIAEIAKALSVIDTDALPPDADKTATGHGLVPSLQAPEESQSASPVVVIEAGTGTGKTLAYVLGTLPLARHL